MFFCWEARADSTSTPGSLNSEISLETSVNLDTSTSKNGLIFAIRHSLKSVSGCCAATSLMPHHADCANLRQLILGSSFFCVHISETKIFVHTMRRRAPCGAEGRIRRGRTWFV